MYWLLLAVVFLCGSSSCWVVQGLQGLCWVFYFRLLPFELYLLVCFINNFFESDMFADPYSDMILVDGITLLCNDIQIAFSNAN